MCSIPLSVFLSPLFRGLPVARYSALISDILIKSRRKAVSPLFFLSLRHPLHSFNIFITRYFSDTGMAMSISPDCDRKNREPDTILVSLSISPMATIQDDDELLLARIGYKQVRASMTK